MDKIFLTDLSARGVIGVYDWERSVQQEILLNVCLDVDLRRAGESDDVVDSVDYAALSQTLLDHVAEAAPRTVEALAASLARLCLENPGVTRARVRVEKPGAVRFARSVGVEIERERADFEPGA
jgi:FolB domain-containing protein